MDSARLADAGFRYPGSSTWVFQHLNITISPGETVRLVGRNGTGKTTLLKVFSGILALSEGRFDKRSDLKASYMDQFAGEMLSLGLTVREQITVATGQAIQDGERLISSFGLGLEDRLGEFVGHLSGGQRQVLALVTTIVSGANLLCLDEFMSSMDDQSAQAAGEVLRRVQHSGDVAILLVSHSSLPMSVSREFEIRNGGGNQ